MSDPTDQQPPDQSFCPGADLSWMTGGSALDMHESRCQLPAMLSPGPSFDGACDGTMSFLEKRTPNRSGS